MNEMVNQLLAGIEQGSITQDEIESLNKALTAGYGGAGKPTDLTGGGVLQAESLDSTLKSVTFEMKNLKFWPAVSMDKAYNLFEQYNRLIGVGSDSSPYIGEGGAPQEEDSTYVRDGQKVVFFGTRRKVSHQMTLVRSTVGDVIAQQAKEGTMHLLKNIERECYWGHAHFLNASTGAFTGVVSDLPVNSIAMNGLLQQLVKSENDVNVRSGDFEGYGDTTSIALDLAGAVITQDDIEKQATVTLENFGQASELHAEPAVISGFVKQFYPQFRSAPGLQNQTVGYDVSAVMTTAGKMELKPNLFLRPRAGVRLAGVNANAPSAPTVSVAAAGATTAGGSLTLLGTYRTRFTAVNDFGEGAPSASVALTLSGTENSITATVAGGAGAKYIKMYRSAAGGAANTEKFVGNFACNAAGTATITEKGVKQPGLGEAFLLDMRADSMQFKTLSPLTKINFAVVTTALEFGLVMYGCLVVACPRFNSFFQNVGK